MKKISVVAVSALLVVFMISCSKELNPALEAEKVAIVESYIYAGDSAVRVKVTRLLPFSEDTTDATEYISGLQLYVNNRLLSESSVGNYTLNLGEEHIKFGDTFQLRFSYFGDTVSSSAVIPSHPLNVSISDTKIYVERQTGTGGGPPGQMDEIDVSWDNEDGGYYYVVVEYLEKTPDYINSNYADSDFPFSQGMSPMSSSGTHLGMRNLNCFGNYRIVVFHVNKDFVDLYQNLESNSNNITNPVTGITNGYGVFTGMSSDTVFLEVIED